jgi:hypothetical protein
MAVRYLPRPCTPIFAGHSCSIYDVYTPLSPVLVARSTHHEGLYFMSNPDVAFSSVPIPMPTPDRDIPSPAALNVCLRSRTSSPNRDIDTCNSRLGHTGTENIVISSGPSKFPPFRTQSTGTSVSLANNTATHFMTQLVLLAALVTSYIPMWLALSRTLTPVFAIWLRSSTSSLDMSPFSLSF